MNKKLDIAKGILRDVIARCMVWLGPRRARCYFCDADLDMRQQTRPATLDAKERVIDIGLDTGEWPYQMDHANWCPVRRAIDLLKEDSESGMGKGERP